MAVLSSMPILFFSAKAVLISLSYTVVSWMAFSNLFGRSTPDIWKKRTSEWHSLESVFWRSSRILVLMESVEVKKEFAS